MSGDLATILRDWDAAVLVEDGLIDGLPAAVQEAGTVLRAPAAPARIDALEQRLGMRLPTSYRTFLAISDGAYAQPGWGIIGDEGQSGGAETELGLMGCDGVGWLRERDRSCVDIWMDTSEVAGDDDAVHPAFCADEPEDEYLACEPGAESMKAGHLLYALQISGDVDGYTVLLNPLVVDQSGEWEAWDFGPKNPGAMRYRSFAELLARHTSDLAARADDPAGQRLDCDTAATRAADRRIEAEQRLHACAALEQHGALAHASLALLELVVPAQELTVRQSAAEMLGRLDTAEARQALIAVAAETGLVEELQAAIVGPLSASDDPEAQRAAVSILTRPDVEDFVVSSTWPAGRDAVWTAWQATGDSRLLAQAAYCSDPRACEPLARAIVDPALTDEIRTSLVRHAGWPRDPSMIPALLTAAERGTAPLLAIGEALVQLGADIDAIAVLSRAVREDDPYGQAAQRLGWIDDPRAGHCLLVLLEQAASPAVAIALGWFAVPGAARALRRTARDDELRLASIDGLERMPGRGALDALAELVIEGDVLALRALARRRDRRALDPLLELLADPDPRRALAGADGLRDLRDPSAAQPLLAVVLSTDEVELAITAAHALVSMGATQAAHTILQLRATGTPTLRRVVEQWSPRP